MVWRTGQSLARGVGKPARFSGFLTHQRNGRGYVFHVTDLLSQPDAQDAALRPPAPADTPVRIQPDQEDHYAPPRGKGRFSKDKKPKRNYQSLLFRRKRFCRFTVANRSHRLRGRGHLRDFVSENGKESRPPRLTGHARLLPASADGRHQARALPSGCPAALPDQPGVKEPLTCKSSCWKEW